MSLTRLAIALLLVSSFSGTAYAQANRTWVSGVGDDANPCSRTAPCKTFAGTIAKTAAGGEIDVLDPGEFDAVTINKALTIDGSAALGGVLVVAGNGITISAGQNDVVTLRGLTINGMLPADSGANGVNIVQAAAVHIENSTVHQFTTCVSMNPSNFGGTLTIKNTVIHDCGTAVAVGNGTNNLALQVTLIDSFLANAPTASVSGGGVIVNGGGVAGTDPGAAVTLFNTVLTGYTTYALQSSGNSTITVEGGAISDSAVGVEADAGTVSMSNVMTSQNAVALNPNSGVINSFGNNAITAGNQTDGSFSATLPLQ